MSVTNFITLPNRTIMIGAESDLANLPDALPFGTIAVLAGESKRWQLGLDGTWEEMASGGGGGGGGEGDKIIGGLIDGTISTFLSNSYATGVKEYFFRRNYNMTGVSLPNVAYISSSAFAACSALAYAYLDNVQTMGSSAFYACSVLSTVYAPILSSVGSGVFYLAGLVSVDLPSLVTNGNMAFAYCKELVTASIPDIRYLGSSAFAGCEKLETVYAPKVGTLGSYAFTKCSIIESISLPNCSNVGVGAFQSCPELKTVLFGSKASIGASVFVDDYNLISLYLPWSGSGIATTNASAFASTPIGGYSDSAGRFGSIFVPATKWSEYQANTVWWNNFSDRFVSMTDQEIEELLG